MSDSGEGDNESDDSMPHLDTVISGMTPAQDGQLMLVPYLHAYTQMNKIFRHVGPFFQFAANDVTVKMRLLWDFVEGSNGHHYTSIQSMIAYEKDNKLLTPTCGCRTLLRLHRALEFVMKFVRDLGNTSEEESFNRTTSRVYANTLGRYHTKVLLKTFTGVLLMFMPSRQTLIDRLIGGDASKEAEYRVNMAKAVDALQVMYDATQKLFHENDMLDLP